MNSTTILWKATFFSTPSRWSWRLLCSTCPSVSLWLRTPRYATTHCNALQHTATHCNTLQRTVTHCNTLQHSATHCNNVSIGIIHNCLLMDIHVSCLSLTCVTQLIHTCNTTQSYEQHDSIVCATRLNRMSNTTLPLLICDVCACMNASFGVWLWLWV